MKNDETYKLISRMNFEIRWGDCDAAGITYYAKYLDWFTDGRIDFLKQVGLPYHEFFHKAGIVTVALEANCRYKKLLRLEQPVILETTLFELSRTRMKFKYRILTIDEVEAAEGYTTHAFVDFIQGKPLDIRKRHPHLWKKLNGVMAGSINL
ncbi:thioesterase family protein [Desulfosporosinus sp. PR]|uniref:acyl-CoA thioesterase n=1 Tax=Candidatus Desulfosporosinus nitrosoreducens TaxID=3401928 RepID=UPI0027F3F79D|nr:thioesterase family protein [Desulfosporosinus sp. PR]MDQ7096363.1 thioesterase family protein [Desulfosporosinus sp. PR]